MTGTMTLYASRGQLKDDHVVPGDDAHELQIELTVQDWKAYREASAVPNIGRYEVGPLTLVKDQATEIQYLVGSAPCGAPCHCAATAVEITSAEEAYAAGIAQLASRG